MKTINYIILILVSFSLAFATSCSSLQNMPYDDVYYSESSANPAAITVSQQATSQAKQQPEGYQQGTVEAVNQNAPLVTDTVNNNYDTAYNESANNYANSNVSLSLGFGSTYFGSGPQSWSFGGFNPYSPYYSWGYSPYYSMGYSPYFYNYYDSFYSMYPGYGWNSFYSFYPGYSWFGNPFGYYNYYYPNYYSINYRDGYNRRVHHVRSNRMGGSNIPRSVRDGSSAPFISQHSKSSRVGAGGNVGRTPVKPDGSNAGNLKSTYRGRPEGSMRYQKALGKQKSGLTNTQTSSPRSGSNIGNRSANNRGASNARYSGSRSSGSNIPSSEVYRSGKSQNRYQKPSAYRKEKALPDPRYQKPRQYQRLDSHQSRSPKVYYRTNSPRPVRINRPGLRSNEQPTNQRRQNVYRPSRQTKSRSVYRPSYRQPTKVKVYNRPIKNYSPSRSYSEPSRNTSAPSRSYSAPSRSSSNSSGSGNVSRSPRSGGGGGIRR